MDDLISKASVCEILADIYPTDGEKVVAVKEVDKAYEAIQQLPSAQPEIIRCKDCKQFRRWIDTDICFCDITESERSDNDFCSRAERRTNG